MCCIGVALLRSGILRKLVYYKDRKNNFWQDRRKFQVVDSGLHEICKQDVISFCNIIMILVYFFFQKLQQDAVDGAVGIPESTTKNYPESSDLFADDEPDSLSKSTETASTVIDASRHDRLLKKSSEDSGDKTDSELEEMDSETHDEGGKPVSMEEVCYWL